MLCFQLLQLGDVAASDSGAELKDARQHSTPAALPARSKRQVKAARLKNLKKATAASASARTSAVNTEIEDTGPVQAQEMLVRKTLPSRSTQPVSYSENSRDTPFSAQLGTTSRLLQEAVSRVVNVIDDIARTPQRKEELMHGLIHHPQFQAAIQAEGMPSRSDWLITEGVKSQLQEFKQDHLHKTVHGRVASNAVIRAAVCKMGQLAEHGHTELVRNRLGYSRTGLDNALKRLHDQTVFDLLDPHREERCDALTADDLLLVESAWEMFIKCLQILTQF